METLEPMKSNSMSFMVKALGTPACGQNCRVRLLHKERGQRVRHGALKSYSMSSMIFMVEALVTPVS